MTRHTPRSPQERREFRPYAWGLGLALVFTLAPFALVHASALSRMALLIGIGVCAVLQMGVPM